MQKSYNQPLLEILISDFLNSTPIDLSSYILRRRKAVQYKQNNPVLKWASVQKWTIQVSSQGH